MRQHFLTVPARLLVLPSHSCDDRERSTGKELEVLRPEFPGQSRALAGCDGRVVEPIEERQVKRAVTERLGQDPDFAALPGEQAGTLHERTKTRRVAEP